MSAAHHLQALYRDRDGIVRFRHNAIVQHLVERLPGGLNRLFARGHAWSQDDVDQFYQLIGYSLAGYEELSLVSDAAKETANAVVAVGGVEE